MFSNKKNSLEHKLLEAEVDIESKQQEIDELKHLLSRLSLAANNLSPSLDRALDELRQKVKSNSTLSVITQCMNTISKEILQLDESQETPSASNSTSNSPLIERIMSELFNFNILSVQDSNNIKHLINSSSDNESYLISRFVEILQKAIQRFVNKQLPTSNGNDSTISSLDKQATQPRDSIELNRDVESSKQNHCSNEFNEAIISILDVTSPTENTAPFKDELLLTLNNKIAFKSVPPLLTQLSKIVTETYYEEQKKFNEFIDALNVRFIEVNKFLKSEIN